MKSFLETFYEEVLDNLGDPGSTRRITKAKLLRDLHNADMEIFESLLSATGQESMLGYTEKTIKLEVDRNFYPLPEGFRQFYFFSKFDSAGNTQDAFGTKPFYGLDWGVEILSGSRGFRLKPAVLTAGIWTMGYLRSPAPLHYAKAGQVTLNSIVAGVPGEDAGEISLVPGFYVGVEIRIYSADIGAPQVRVVKDFLVTGSGQGVFMLRDALDPLPTGEVWYEISPTLPAKYDSLYAMDVALLNLNRRDKPDKANFFLAQRRKKWAAAHSFFTSNVADRGPTRTRPLRAEDFVPTEVPYGLSY